MFYKTLETKNWFISMLSHPPGSWFPLEPWEFLSDSFWIDLVFVTIGGYRR